MKWGALIAVMLSLPLAASAATTQPPTCVISTPPGSIQPGATARLIWYTENATRASIAGIGEVPLQSTRDVRPSQTTTYVMTVSNASASRTCAVIVTVSKAQQSLLYYNSPQPYVYSPNQMFWSPINVPPKYVNGNYMITDEWEEGPSYGYSASNSWYYDSPQWNDYRYNSIDTEYIPGASYTLTSWYTLPSGNSYMKSQNCVAGLDCITTGVGYGHVDSPVVDVPDDKVQAYLNGEYEPSTASAPPVAAPDHTPQAPLIVIPSPSESDPNGYGSEAWWSRQPNPNPYLDSEPHTYIEPENPVIPASYYVEPKTQNNWNPLPVTDQYEWSQQSQTQYDMYGENANQSWDNNSSIDI